MQHKTIGETAATTATTTHTYAHKQNQKTHMFFIDHTQKGFVKNATAQLHHALLSFSKARTMLFGDFCVRVLVV